MICFDCKFLTSNECFGMRLQWIVRMVILPPFAKYPLHAFLLEQGSYSTEEGTVARKRGHSHREWLKYRNRVAEMQEIYLRSKRVTLTLQNTCINHGQETPMEFIDLTITTRTTLRVVEAVFHFARLT